MKLLEDMSSVEVRSTPGKRSRVTLAITGGILVVGAATGFLLLSTSSDLGEGSAPSDTAGDGTTVELTAWVDGATQACATVAAEHPVLTEGGEARAAVDNIAAVDAGTRALADAVRALPVPTDATAQAQVGEAVALGDQADQAWYGLAGAPDDATAEQLGSAAGLTTAFVTGLVDLGADCAALG